LGKNKFIQRWLHRFIILPVWLVNDLFLLLFTQGGYYLIDGSDLTIKAGGKFEIESCATLEIINGGRLVIESGAEICIHPGAFFILEPM
jgi:hypothetical protein